MDRKNKFPKTLNDAYTLLKGWKKGVQKNPNRIGVSFNIDGDEEGDTLVNHGKQKYDGPSCERCGHKSHPTSKCRAKKHMDGTLLHVEEDMGEVEADELDQVSTVDVHVSCPADVHELMFLNSDGIRGPKSCSSRGPIPDTWILIDSQSTIDIFCNGKLLTRIHKVETTMHIRCNAGVKSTNLRGYLSGYGWVWYFPEGIANILSLSRVKDKFRVTFDSAADNCFHVHKPGSILKFKEASRRLYYFDTADRHEDTVLVTTVADNMSKFSAYDVSKAKIARTLQKRIGRPSVKDYIRYVDSNMIPNCPITSQDIRNAETIWGPDLGCLKGKTVWRQPKPVQAQSHTIPASVMQQYKNVTLSADVMKVNGIPF